MKQNLLKKLEAGFALHKKLWQFAAYLSLVAGLSFLTYLTYNQYRNTIINQQLQQMLGISRTISRSIELFLNDIEDSVKAVTLDKEFIKSISSLEMGKNRDTSEGKLQAFYEAQGKTVYADFLYNSAGKPLTQFPKGIANLDVNLQSDLSTVISSKKGLVGKAYLDDAKNTFLLNVYQPIFEGNKLKGVMAVAISIDVIYDRLIAPAKIGEKGYVMVKDQNGLILMHPVKEQVGIDVIDSRKQMYPNLDYKELEKLINDQLTGQEGTAVYHSYWWGDNVLEKSKKLSAYTPVEIGDSFWVVASTMSYDEIQGPVYKFLSILIGIACLIAIIIYIFITTLIKMRRNKEKLEEETEYLRMLNEASEQLRKKEAELYHSHKLKMIGTLAGGIAHDINNLLSPILGYSELLLMRMPEDSEYHEDIEEIYKASQKGKDLIEQILVFSRNDNGIVKVEPININEVVRQTIKLLKVMLPKKVSIKENIEREIGLINANFTQIHQVIFNLCTNAYQAMDNKKGLIEISLDTAKGKDIKTMEKNISEKRNYAEIIIKDNGCGMDEETKLRIFDPFFTTKSIGEGTGLGLFVVHSIIDKYEGAILVESEPGKGSLFKVYLPLIDEKSEKKKNNESRSLSHNKKKILIVDDNDQIIKVLRKGLEHLGYQVYTETDSLKAIEKFKSEYKKVDLVITDYLMPGLKGDELAAAIKEINNKVKVLLITGYMDGSQGNISDIKTVDGCMAKPVELSKLSEMLKKLLSEAS